MGRYNVSKQAIRLEARKGTNKEALRRSVERSIGEPLTAASFDAILREALPLEAEYQAEIISSLKKAYPRADIWKEAAGPYSQKGRPDVSALVDGHFFGFEVKRPYIGVLSDIQAATIKKIRRAGGTAEVVSFGSEAVRIVAATIGGADHG